MAKWSTPPAELVDRMQRRLNFVVAKATFDAFASAVKRSPVDTGRFRANWNVARGTFDASTSESTAAARSEAELRKALAFPAGGVVYLTNSLPYAEKLENGWSKQAPNGMVRLTALEWSTKVAAAITIARNMK